MCRDWIKGTKEFRKAVLEDLEHKTVRRVTEAESAGISELRGERAVVDLLARLGKNRKAPKS